MSTAKHTPGPWIVGDTDRYTRNNGSAPPAGMTRLCSIDGIAIYVAKNSLCDDPVADAKVLAAAPDMVSALTDILVWCVYAEKQTGVTPYGLQVARDALAKAGV